MNDSKALSAYMERQLTRLMEAIDANDGDTGVAVLKEMTAAGHRAEADMITNLLISSGLRRLADLAAQGDTETLWAVLGIAAKPPTSPLAAVGDHIRAERAGGGQRVRSQENPDGNVVGWVPVRGRGGKS